MGNYSMDESLNTSSKEPYVLFIIGNGFDLSMGMKTKYEDMYESYCNTPSSSKTIENFKQTLSNREPYDKWSDFEMGMAEYAKTLSNEAQFVECVRDFKAHMAQHLQTENQKIISAINNRDYTNKLLEELDRSFEEFYMCFSPNVIRQLNSLVSILFLASPKIITFNYTTGLDELLLLRAKKDHTLIDSPLHIHGSLKTDVVLGVDNISQLEGCSYSISQRGERSFVKTIFNQQYDSKRVSEAKQLISNSQIICTYGFSMGESDKTWIGLLVDWLKQSVDHHLIVYQYDKTEYRRYIFDALMDAEDEKKAALLTRLGLTESKLADQIHIPIGYDIFNFDFSKIVVTGVPTPTPPMFY